MSWSVEKAMNDLYGAGVICLNDYQVIWGQQVWLVIPRRVWSCMPPCCREAMLSACAEVEGGKSGHQGKFAHAHGPGELHWALAERCDCPDGTTYVFAVGGWSDLKYAENMLAIQSTHFRVKLPRMMRSFKCAA